jgi:hypothetical protein
MTSDTIKDICKEEIESWGSYEYSLREDDAEYFHQMLDESRQYSDAINKKDGLIPTEPVVMALLLIQHKVIKNLLSLIETARMNEKVNCLKNSNDRK